MTPFWFVVIALVAYAIAYLWYGRRYEREIWQPDPKRTTPAHMYMDGVEFFPSSRYVLWGYQFKSIAALGPILGPFIGVTYGWLPALIWIILGNFFIGWVHDYSAIMLTVRNEGKSMGPISYELLGPAGRNTLLGFLLFYLLLISAVFIYLVSLFWNIFPTTFMATLGVIVTGIIVGQLIYRAKMSIVPVTIIAIVLVIASIFLGMAVPMPKNFLGAWTVPFWAAVMCVFLYFGAVLPMPTFAQPTIYVAFFPAFAGVILIILGALLSPITGVRLLQPAFTSVFPKGMAGPGPIWPILTVSIACGAISGWHSLVGTSTTGKQLDIETDAYPVGAGAMLTEGLLALASLAAYMVCTPDIIAKGKVGAFVAGATKLTSAYLGNEVFFTTFFGLFLAIYALTVQILVTRFMRMFFAEMFPDTIWANMHVATIISLIVAWLFAVSGSWINLWLYFGGSNQLLAGMALMLVTIYLARQKRSTSYTLGPAIFMLVTTLAALIWETWVFIRAFIVGKPLVKPPLDKIAYPTLAFALNGLFVIVGVVLFILGIRMTIMAWRRYQEAKAA
ncbi:MAG TPA: carbon starvation protein A [Chloroflexi bacterium]|nr:carbon starvation protein A [Chloroflexota bacterium]